MLSRDHHSTWANTAAIQTAGLDASTPDPADGVLIREADGFPAGTFHEGAGNLFAHVTPAADPELAYRGLLRAQERLIALGITGWQDAMIGDLAGTAEGLEAYRRALAEGTLRVHVDGAQWWERDGGAEQVAQMVARRDEIAALGSDRLRLGTTKIMVDGVAENHTAAMLTPYRDEHGHDSGASGLTFVPAGRPARICHRPRCRGHAGALPCTRRPRRAGGPGRAGSGARGERRDRRPTSPRAPADGRRGRCPRFAGLDATANIQALWATHEDQLDELTLPFLRDGAEARHYPFGDLARAGARLAGGSDWPVSSAAPIDAIHVAVNRAYPGSGLPSLGGAGQCLDLATAMAAYTSGTAWINHREHETGRIAPGFAADLIVLDPDPFTLPSADIHLCEVAATWIGGTQVYTRTPVTTGEHS
ncbi:amidohydrolase [Microbacterium elymi]|uniref:amidohydrolase n=1 Tax=Microbacterium elymi TaxID=2909587 RepID=UPI003F49A664